MNECHEIARIVRIMKYAEVVPELHTAALPVTSSRRLFLFYGIIQCVFGTHSNHDTF